MSEADIEYRGHFIDVQSHESDGKHYARQEELHHVYILSDPVKEAPQVGRQ